MHCPERLYNFPMQNFHAAWRYEIVRQTEIDAGPLDDDDVNRRVVSEASSAAQQLLARARDLGPRVQADASIVSVRRTARRVLLASVGLAFLGGISAGLTLLGDPARPVNLLWTMMTALLLPTVSLIVWLIALLAGRGSAGWLGRAWALGVARWVRGGPTSRAWQALISLMQASGAERAWLSLLTHLIWAVTLAGVLLALLLAFSLRHYTFVWQTTWLGPEAFVQAVNLVGDLPGWLGFVGPDAATIAASGNTALDNVDARTAWAHWLLGAVFTYGLLPRLVFLVGSLLVLRRRLAKPFEVPKDAYAIALAAKLQRASALLIVDGPPGAADSMPQAQFLPASLGRGQAIVALEGGGQARLSAFAAPVVQLPVMDTRASRQEVLERLDALHPARLLVVCDSGQTPDRGLINALLSLACKTVELRVWLIAAPAAGPDRRPIWRGKLAAIGLPPPFESLPAAQQWLEVGQHG